VSRKITIASASSAEYFHFLQGMMLSVRDKPQSRGIDISLYDLGLTFEQIAWLKGYVNNIVKPKWEYGLTARDGMRDPFRAILAKPLLRKFFPGCEVYQHLDADARVQDWSAIEHYLAGAESGALAITTEIHRAYTASTEFRELCPHLGRGLRQEIRLLPDPQRRRVRHAQGLADLGPMGGKHPRVDIDHGGRLPGVQVSGRRVRQRHGLGGA